MSQPPYEITYEDSKHKYTLDGEPVPSVTEILDKTASKDALPWWGMRVGMAGALKMLETVGVSHLTGANTHREIVAGKPDKGKEFFTRNDKRRKKPKTLVEALVTDAKLTTNHIKEEAGDRGTSIHTAMEALGMGVAPDPMTFPAEHRGYIQGLVQWWLDFEPEFLQQELIVGSRRWKYAGRFDARIRYHAGPHEGQHLLLDLKTSKGVYMSHAKQLTGYEIAWNEMGLGAAFDAKQVLHVPGDGSYRLVECIAPERSFTAAVELFHADQYCAEVHREIGVTF